MATSIGGVAIDLKLESASFMRDMAKATNSIKSHSAQMSTSLLSIQRASNLVTKSLGALGIALGVREIVNFGTRALQAGAGLGELAEQTGVSTDALQVYQFAATQSGVKTEELETALMRLTKSLGEAEQGNTAIIKAFRAMGVSTVDASGKALKTEQVLGQMADAYIAASDKAKFMASAVDVGGRSFQRLAPFLSGGAQQLDTWAEAARRAGAVLNDKMIKDLDDASDELAKFNFWLNRTAAQMGGEALGAARKWAEGIGESSDQIAEMERELRGLQATLSKFEGALPSSPAGKIAANTREKIAVVEDRIAGLRASRARNQTALDADRTGSGIGIDEGVFSARGAPLTQMTEAQKKFNEEIDRSIRQMQEEAALVGLSARALFVESEARKAQTAAISQQVELSPTRLQQLRAEAGALYDAKAAEEARGEAMKRFTAELEADSEAWKKRADLIDSMSKTVPFDLQQEADDLKRLTEAAKESNKAYETEVTLLAIRNKLRAAGLPDGDAEVEQYRELAENVGTWKDQLDEARDHLEDMKDVGRDFGHAIGTAFEDAILKGDKLSDVFRALLEDINRIILRVIVTKPLEKALTDWLTPSGGGSGGGSWFGSLFSSGGGSGGGAEAQAIGQMYAGSGFAEGTSSAPPGMAWVGEEGPELIRFRGGEQVIPSDVSSRMAGGSMIYQTVNVTGAVDNRSLTQLERAAARGSGRGRRR